MFRDLEGFIERLEVTGELLRVQEELSPTYEIAAAMSYLDRRTGKAVLFEKVKGTTVPVVGLLLGTRRRLAMALEAQGDVTEEYLARCARPVKPVIVDDGPVQEVVIKDSLHVLREMPVLTHHERDAGPYLTSAVTIAKDPETGIRGMGIHRVQVKDSDRLGIFLGTPPLSEFLKKAEAKNQPLEVAIVVGMDPLSWFSSVAWAPSGVDKFDIAGALAQSSIPLVKCKTIGVEVPASAEFVLEGYIAPHVRETEGPFGETTGYYLTYDNPVVRIKALTRRKKPIYHALMPLTGEGMVIKGVSWEAENLRAVQSHFPNVKKLHLTTPSVGTHSIVQVEKKSKDEVAKIIDHIFSLGSYIKMVVVVDSDVDIFDPAEVEWALATRFQADADILIRSGLGSPIDPSNKEGNVSAKLGIDATVPLDSRGTFQKIAVAEEASSTVKSILAKYVR